MELSYRKKKKGIFCCAYACKNKPSLKKGGLCHKHYARKVKERDPVAARYNNFKQKAKQRVKPVFVTLEEFRQFCRDTGYILTKGKRGKNATIDRIINEKGYFIKNMQLLTLRQNSSKGKRPADDLPF